MKYNYQTTLFGTVHGAAGRALIMFYEIDRTGKRSQDAISGRTLNAITNLSGKVFGCLVAALDVSERKEKDLFSSETFQSR